MTEAAKHTPTLAEREWQTLLEQDDRTSPAEYPDMALITFDEFAPSFDLIETYERALKDIAYLRPLGPTRNKMVEQMERIAINALAASRSPS